MENKPDKVITHTSVTPTTWTAKDIGQIHYDRWNGYNPSSLHTDVTRYGGYHIVVEWSGKWTIVRPFNQEGVHARGQNFSSIGVCFIGNGDNHLPSQAQIDAWTQEIWPHIQEQFPNITTRDIFPHRNYANKSCHGKLLSDTYYADLLDQPSKDDKIRELIRKIEQLISVLMVLLAKERMKG